ARAPEQAGGKAARWQGGAGPSGLRSTSRQHHLEDCTTGPAADGYRAAVPLDDCLDDRQAEPAAARRIERARWIRLVEEIEYVRLLFGRDASPFVLDRQRDATGRKCRHQLDAGPPWRVPNRVSGEILQRLLEAIAVAAHSLSPRID